MFIDNLYDFFKKINYRLILPVLLCPVLLLCTSISGYAYIGDNNNFYPIIWHNATNVFFRSRDISNTNIGSRYDTELVTGQNAYYSTINETLSGIGCYFFYREESQLDFNFLPDEFDYYFVFTVTSSNDLNFVPTSVRLRSKPDIAVDNNIYTFLTDIVSYTHNDKDTSGYTVIGKLPSVTYTSIYGFDIYQRSNVGTLSGDIRFEGLIYCTPKGESNAVGSIISAINNQTTQQNNNFNNFMGSGSQFGGTTSGILSGNDELSGYIDDYTQIEQTMHNNFESAQSALIGDFTGFTWGSLANTLSWTSDYMQQIYLNSGDFKMMIILPLLLGIALFFIGRGAIILSNSNKDN